jgi:hypothetical protein
VIADRETIDRTGKQCRPGKFGTGGVEAGGDAVAEYADAGN